MHRAVDVTCPPLNTLKPVAENVWIVDGPAIRFDQLLGRFARRCSQSGWKDAWDLRLTFRRHQAEFREAVETMISWHPKRILLAHGRWYDRDGAAKLTRAFRWVSPRSRPE